MTLREKFLLSFIFMNGVTMSNYSETQSRSQAFFTFLIFWTAQNLPWQFCVCV